ncbi:MAG: sodium:calcium antiporter [Planctomycetia bacterium]
MHGAVTEFGVLALVVVAAGVFLSRAADHIAEATGLGRVLVGSLLLAAATSLPELTVDVAAVREGLPDLAIGDLFGSSLMNLLILAVVDLGIRRGRPMFSREAAAHALPATLSIVLTATAGLAILTAGRLPEIAVAGVGWWSLVILLAYLIGARMVFIDQRISARAARDADECTRGEAPGPERGRLGLRALLPSLLAFGAAAAVLWWAGPRLAKTAGVLADETGLGGTFVGTTLVALTTSLPELVAAVTAVRSGALDLAIGNTFGSNAFNMILFVPLDAVYPGSLFAAASPAHAVTVLAVIAATAVAVLGQLYHADRRVPIVEPDALLIVAIVCGGLALVYRLS